MLIQQTNNTFSRSQSCESINLEFGLIQVMMNLSASRWYLTRVLYSMLASLTAIYKYPSFGIIVNGFIKTANVRIFLRFPRVRFLCNKYLRTPRVHLLQNVCLENSDSSLFNLHWYEIQFIHRRWLAIIKFQWHDDDLEPKSGLMALNKLNFVIDKQSNCYSMWANGNIRLCWFTSCSCSTIEEVKATVTYLEKWPKKTHQI